LLPAKGGGVIYLVELFLQVFQRSFLSSLVSLFTLATFRKKQDPPFDCFSLFEGNGGRMQLLGLLVSSWSYGSGKIKKKTMIKDKQSLKLQSHNIKKG